MADFPVIDQAYCPFKFCPCMDGAREPKPHIVCAALRTMKIQGSVYAFCGVAGEPKKPDYVWGPFNWR